MEIVKSIVFILFAYGLTFGLVYSRGLFGIFEKIRYLLFQFSKEFQMMFECTYCTSCNVGLWSSVINMLLLPNKPFTIGMLLIGDISMWYYILLVDIFVTSACVYFLDTIENYLSHNKE